MFIVNCNITISILLAIAMEAPDFDVDAFNGGLCCINADGANAAVDNVIKQDKSILDQFDEDGLDFNDFDWDRLDVDHAGGLATPDYLQGADNSQRLPTRVAESTGPLPPSLGRSFDTQSMANFYDKGSSLPQHPEQTPPPTGRHQSRKLDSNNDVTPTLVERRSKPSNWKSIRHVRSRDPSWLLRSNVTAAQRIITEKTSMTPKPWQISVMIDAVYTLKDVVVSAGTGSGKSLPYQLIPLIKENAIVLVILPTIALMNDQVRYTIYF